MIAVRLLPTAIFCDFVARLGMDSRWIRDKPGIKLLAMVVILAAGMWAASPAWAGDLTWCNRGDAKADEGSWRQAEKLYGLCITNGELEGAELASAHHRHGRALMKLKRFDQALGAMDAALAADDAHAPAWNTRAWLGLLTDSLEQALSDAERALNLAPDNVRAIDTQAHILAALGRGDEALAAFNRAVSLYDSEGVAKYQNALAAAGYDPGSADGVAGARTHEALAACVADACNLWPIP